MNILRKIQTLRLFRSYFPPLVVFGVFRHLSENRFSFFFSDHTFDRLGSPSGVEPGTLLGSDGVGLLGRSDRRRLFLLSGPSGGGIWCYPLGRIQAHRRSEASVNQQPLIPELHPPLLDDNTRRQELNDRFGIHVGGYVVQPRLFYSSFAVWEFISIHHPLTSGREREAVR